MRNRPGWAVVMVAVGTLAGACQSQTAAPKTESTELAPAPVGTVKDLMKGMIDPSATAIWNAVATVDTPKGVVEQAPETDEDWAHLEYHALSLAEAANLLKTPGRKMARAEEANTKTTSDAPELTPRQIEEKVEKDRAAWGKKIDALQATAVKAIAAARAHDKDAILDVGSEIDNACESCHKVYWYPDEKIPEVPAAAAAGESKPKK